MSMCTSKDVVEAAMSVAQEAAEGKLDPSVLDAALADEMRQEFADVVGHNDSLWPLQVDVARRVIALGGISADELNEWAAALRHRDAEPSSEPDADDDPPELRSTGSVELSAENDALDADLDVEPDDDEIEHETQPDDEQPSSTESDCGCSDTGPTSMTTLPDGRSVPRHRIVGRGPSVY